MSDPVSPSNCPKCGALVPPDAPQGYCLHCLLALGAAEPESPSSPEDEGEPTISRSAHFAGRSVGDYELLEELGRGGMGVVFKARQKSLDRFVAVKTLRLGEHADKDVALRLRAEAAAAASLHHPHIVAIHEVGAHAGQPFFAMEFIEGQNLARVSAACETRDAVWIRRAARWVRTIAAAIHHAHERGILHRDLKPSNVLIDPLDEPRITDFGLAKRLTDSQGSTADTQLTLSGQPIGSPNYMPPEQAVARRGQVGRRSDIYSLGAILYHLLTGRPPCVGQTLAETLQELMNREPIAPRLLNAAVPRDLETLCLKCLEKEPDRRYPTAEALAEDLDRFLRDEPIQARPAGRAEKAWRWCRRKPQLATSLAGLLLALVTGVLGIAWQWRRAEAHATAETYQRQLAEKHLYAADMVLAQQSLNEFNRGYALQFLKKYLPSPNQLDLRGWEWRYLWEQCRSDEVRTVGNFERTASSLALSPDGRALAVGLTDGTVRLFETQGWTVSGVLTNGASVLAVGFSPNGQQLLAGGKGGQLHIWNIWNGEAWRHERVLQHGDMQIESLVFSPDGSFLATGADRGIDPKAIGIIRLFETRGWTEIASFPSTASTLSLGIAFSPDNRIFAFNSIDGAIRLWSVPNRSPIATLQSDHSSPIRSILFSSDARTLIAGSSDPANRITVWDVVHCTPVATLTNFRGWVGNMALSPDGKFLAAPSADQLVRLFDTASWKEIGNLKGHLSAHILAIN